MSVTNSSQHVCYYFLMEKKMSIYRKICSGMANHKSKTSKDAKYLYLGREDVKELSRWVYDLGYIDSPEFKNKEGDSRPEVAGLFIYEVNDDRHMAFSS